MAAYQSCAWANRRRLVASAGPMALLAGCFVFVQSPAFAQTKDAPEAQGAVSEVVVTGSRTITDGSAAPTPLTVVSGDELRASSPASIIDALNEIPSFQGSIRPAASSSSGTGLNGNGGNFLSLRGLGPQRTLVLIDGQRIVPANTRGAPDVNLIPQGLVQRVDVVTGGASAAYGSDAVAGVVNFILDTKFTGLKGEIEGGTSSRSDANSIRASLTGGQGFLDDKLHVVGSAEFSQTDGIDLDYNGRKWAEQGWGLIGAGTTPATNIIAPNVGYSVATRGGLITGPAVIANQQFLPGGALAPFNAGAFKTSSTESGGDGAMNRTNLIPGITTESFFGHATYEVNDSFRVFGEAQFAEVKTKFLTTQNTATGTSAYTIFSDNAFIPAALQSVLTANNIGSFTLGRTAADWPAVFVDSLTDTERFVVGFQGKLPGDWSYSGYYQYGRSTNKVQTLNNPIEQNVYNAADAVVNPANGQVVCRTTLTNPTNGCVPMNLFGFGAPSAASIAYATGTSFFRLVNEQQVAAFDVKGQPFSTWAGPVAVAFGVEHRHEDSGQVVDPISASIKSAGGVKGFPTALVGSPGGFLLSNPQAISGSFSVTEGYLEVDAPLLKDMALAKSLDFNGAVRYADYSTVGGQTTWKVGLVYQPVEDLRLRFTRSRDIRAPNISELFTGAQQTIGLGVNDPNFANARFTVTQRVQGNPNLGAEDADTTTYGFVYKPSYIPGLMFSVDAYKIDIANVISQVALQDVVNGCAAGNNSLCSLVLRNADGTINTIITPTQNIASLATRGEDFELDYSTPLDRFKADLPGNLRIRLLATHLDELSTTVNGIKNDRVGDLDIGAPTLPAGAPDWTATFNLTYAVGDFSFFWQQRYLAAGIEDHTQVFNAASITKVPAVNYTDLTVRYDLRRGGRTYQLYGTVNNLFDQDPPITPGGAATTPRAANPLYDFIGRYYTVGVRFKL
jgi:iron complex outermembrane receptor protein